MLLNLHLRQVEQAIAALREGESLLVLGEPGSGKSVLAQRVQKQLEAEGKFVAIGLYLGSAKGLLTEIAEAFGIPIEVDNGNGKFRKLTVDELRTEIGHELKRSDRILICDDAERWPQSVRLWLEACWKAQPKATLLLLSDRPPASGIFVKVPRLEMQPAPLEHIRELMVQEAQDFSAALTTTELAELQQKVGGNPALAKRVVRERFLSLESPAGEGDHYRYVDGTPFLIAGIGLVSIVRFVGLGLGDRSLYILGGVAMSLAILLRVVMSQINKKSTRLGRRNYG